MFAAGETETALQFLTAFSRRRLLGDHVPYVVEAWPEGGQAQLGAESALYCRVFTEGLFGLTPTGFDTFTCRPRLPAAWDRMALRGVHAFGGTFDVEVERASATQLRITLATAEGKKMVRDIRVGEDAVFALARPDKWKEDA